MKVKNIETGKVSEAVKISATMYLADGKEVKKEDMAKLYTIVKEVPKVVSRNNETETETIISGKSDMGGNIGALALALSKCQGEFTSVTKDKEGHGYSYADIEAVLKASTPITSKFGLAVTQVNITTQVGAVTLSGVKTILIHSEGGYISGECFIPTIKTKMNGVVQIHGINTTYLRRYGLQSILGLATTDTDGVSK